jgi:Na+/H+ antiporter NhaA
LKFIFSQIWKFVQNISRQQEIAAGILLAFAAISAISISNSPFSEHWLRFLISHGWAIFSAYSLHP